VIKIFPAIDLYEGKVVRLHKGDFNKLTVYGDDPLAFAEKLYNEGARFLHVVDLEGARKGKPSHLDVLYRITQSLPINVQYGGGLRTTFYIEDVLEAGAFRAVVSTRALFDIEFLKLISETYSDRIAISLDIKGEYVYAKGWQEAAMTLDEALELVAQYSLPSIIFTDIERDGSNLGVNIEFVEKMLKKSPSPAIFAGGISSFSDIMQLAKYETLGLEGVIVGKAYYEGLVNLREIFELLPQEEA
jgi:phosphoribosylformimino-5-aminoimidazole carboxamide ribotide isomerase